MLLTFLPLSGIPQAAKATQGGDWDGPEGSGPGSKSRRQKKDEEEKEKWDPLGGLGSGDEEDGGLDGGGAKGSMVAEMIRDKHGKVGTWCLGVWGRVDSHHVYFFCPK